MRAGKDGEEEDEGEDDGREMFTRGKGGRGEEGGGGGKVKKHLSARRPHTDRRSSLDGWEKG